MDRNTITAIVICMLCLFGLQIIIPKFFPPIKVPVHTNVVMTASGKVVTNIVATNAQSAPVTTSTSTMATPVIAFDTNAPEQLLVISNAVARYTFTSRGGGMKTVDLLRYPETVSPTRQKKTTAFTDVATLNNNMPLPVGALIDDGTVSGDGNYTLTATAAGVRAEKTLTNGLTVVKTFALGTNYLLTESVRIENRGEATLTLPDREVIVGSATPMGPPVSGRARSMVSQFVGVGWYDGTKMDATASQAWFANSTFMSCFTHHTEPRSLYQGGSNNVAWVAAHMQFFTWIGVPQTNTVAVRAHAIDLPRDQFTLTDPTPPQGFAASLVYPAVKLAPGQAVEEKISIYGGPKEYRTLVALAEDMKNNVDLVMGFGGSFFAALRGGFSRVLLLTMDFLHDSFRIPYGWAIIVITVAVRLIFWPLTAAGTRSMKRMSALQPQMKAIQEKYKDNPSKMNQKTMEFMKEHKLNPVGGCLPMLIQLPILWGFYGMIQSAIELRGAPFLWIGDLTQPDTLFTIPGLGMVPLFGLPGVGLPINLLPLIMVGSQIWQAHLTPPSPGMDPAQQKMMRFMPLMFLLFFYNMSAGLTLYWTVSNLLSILQTKMTKTDPKDPLLAIHPKKAK